MLCVPGIDAHGYLPSCFASRLCMKAISASKRVANTLPGDVEGHVHTVLHDDVHRRTDDKGHEGRHA